MKKSLRKYLTGIPLLLLGIIIKSEFTPVIEKIPEWIKDNIWYGLLLLYIGILSYDAWMTKKEIDRLENVDKKKLEQNNNKLKIELAEEKQRSSKPHHIHKRFEKIIKKELKYVAIDYKPFFWTEDDAKKETPRGLGCELMFKIFEPFDVQLINETPANGYGWKSIFDDFSNNRRSELDFIMTPMYETRSRLYDYDVIYSIPLFYSDIGVYVKKTVETESLSLSFDDIATFLVDRRDGTEGWKLEFMEGEISEIVGKKSMYNDLDKEDVRRKLSKDDSRRYKYKNFSEKLKNVAAENKSTGDVILIFILECITFLA